RTFITLLGGAAASWPLAARAQQPTKLPTIGFLGANNPTFERASIDAFVQRLHELGWIENRTVSIEYRWAEGREERFAEIAAEFIRLKVDVIFTDATPSSIAAKKATAIIPIVFAAAGDPVGTGLVASLARPGGNITGLSISKPILPASVSKCCARFSPVSARWRSCSMPAAQTPCWKWARLRRRPARSASLWSHRRAVEPRISRLRSTPSGAARMHFMSARRPL